MKRVGLTLGVLLLLSAVVLAQRRAPREMDASNPPLAKTEAEKKILAVLDEMVRERKTYLSVPMTDGKALRVFTEALNAQHVVEIGTSTGYSGLWICLALQATGGRLTTYEIDAQRAAMAREHFKRAGVEKIVTVIEGDAHALLAKLQGTVDLAFIDADKEGYVDYLNQLLPRMRPGGLILAHNINTNAEYVRAVTSSPQLETIFYMEGAGLGVTLKKR